MRNTALCHAVIFKTMKTKTKTFKTKVANFRNHESLIPSNSVQSGSFLNLLFDKLKKKKKYFGFICPKQLWRLWTAFLKLKFRSQSSTLFCATVTLGLTVTLYTNNTVIQRKLVKRTSFRKRGKSLKKYILSKALERESYVKTQNTYIKSKTVTWAGWLVSWDPDAKSCFLQV